MSTIAPAELVERIWARDATLWTGGDEAKWLGWLDEPMRMRSRLEDLLRFVEDVTAPGVIDTFVLLGMGGSSLAPHVLAKTRHDPPCGDPAREREPRLREHAVHRGLEVRDDPRDAVPSRLLLGQGRQARRAVRRDHRSGLRAR